MTKPATIKPATGAAVRAWRQARGLSQEQLGGLLGTRQATISAWENGGEIFNPTILALALLGLEAMAPRRRAPRAAEPTL